MNRRKLIQIVAISAFAVCGFTQSAFAQKPEPAGEPLVTTSVVWEECYEKKVLGEKIKACARLLEESSKFYLELEIAGKRKKWEVAEKCYESDKVSFGFVEAYIEVCLSDLKFTGNKLESVKIRAWLCGKAFGEKKCAKVYEDTIRFLYKDGKSLTPGAYVSSGVGAVSSE
ncbi:hypothetical protein [Rosistilla oblonga]|uniref:hypothetical protein n=1 Tax=Rosistilla oblonga TaxID=2527990 RepID=UPI003A970966